LKAEFDAFKNVQGEVTDSQLVPGVVVNGEELSFELVAAETQTSVLMKDGQTQSVWDAYTGEAIEGPLKGTRLEQEIGTTACSQNWRAFHPESIELPIRDGNSR